MTPLQRAKEVVPHLIHDPDYVVARTKFRGLIRSINSLEENAKSTEKRKVKKRANPSPDTSNPEGEGS